MCGIAGILALDGAPIDHRQIERMTRSLAHRGPDDAGVYVSGPIALGHRRLSIVDLEGGHQPMTTDDGSVWITFNGEVFNYLELREDLRQRGHHFRTQSDTEVILRLYLQHGPDCVRLMNGEWAFALWDSTRRQLLLSRDRFGVRPLFYSILNGRLLFASEIKALFEDPRVPREVDLHALDQLMTFWAPLAPRTFFKGISELRPGHSLTIRNGALSHHSYWKPEEFVADDRTIAPNDAAERLLALLDDATRIRMRADVPVAAYLSGGLDSTLTTALAARTSSTLQTFSVSFDDPSLDESTYQRHAVEHVGTQHTDRRCTPREIARVFPEVVWHTERPVLRTAPAPLFLLSQAVHERGYRVVLSGEGADETLGGYDIFKETKIRRFWSRFPESRRRSMLLRRLYPYQQDLQRQPNDYLRAFFSVTASDAADPLFSHLPRWTVSAQLKRFYSSDVRHALDRYDPLDEVRAHLPEAFGRWDDLARAQYLEITQLLPGYILSSQGDRMAMAHGVESRVPFLDHRVFEYAATLPAHFKMKALDEKWILKRAARPLVPAPILARNKQPYRAPDAACFFGPSANEPEYAREALSPSRLRSDGLFDAVAVDRLIDKARRRESLGVRDNMALIGILSTQLVVDRFIRTFAHAGH